MRKSKTKIKSCDLGCHFVKDLHQVVTSKQPEQQQQKSATRGSLNALQVSYPWARATGFRIKQMGEKKNKTQHPYHHHEKKYE